MRVTQVDYSAIMNANSSKFGIKQTSLENKQFREDLSHMKEMKKHQETLDTLNDVKVVFQSIGNIVQTADNIAGAFRDEKAIRVEAEKGEANAFLEELSEGLNLAIDDTAMNGGSANRDPNGNVILNDALVDLKASQQEQLNAYEALPEIKEAMQKSFDGMWDDAEFKLAKGLQARDIEVVAKARELELDNAVIEDAKNNNTNKGFALIDSWTHLTPKEREYQKSIYPKLVEQQRAANQKVLDAAIAEQHKAWKDSYREAIIGSVEANGIAATIGSIEADKNLTGDERLEFVEYAKGVESKVTSTLAIKQAEAFSHYMDSAEVPVPLGFKQALQDDMDAKGYDANRQKKIMDAVETEWLSYIQAAMTPNMSLVAYMGEEELDSFKENIETGELSILFAGMEKEKDPYIKLIDGEKKKYTEARDAIAKAETKFNKEMTDDFHEKMNATQASLNAGRISAVEAVAGLRSYMNTKYPDVNSLAIETEILNFENKVLTNATYPTPFKTQAENFIKTLKQTGENFFSADGQTPEEVTTSVIRVQAEATAQLLDFFTTHSMEELKDKPELLTDEMDRITNGYFGEIIGKLEKIQDETSTADGVYEEQIGSLMKQIGSLTEASGAVTIDRDGRINWRNEAAQKVFENLATFGQHIMQDKLGLELMGMPQPLSEEMPLPVFQATTGDKFMFDENGDFIKVWEYTPSGDVDSMKLKTKTKEKRYPTGEIVESLAENKDKLGHVGLTESNVTKVMAKKKDKLEGISYVGLVGTPMSGEPTNTVMLKTEDFLRKKPAKKPIKVNKNVAAIANEMFMSGTFMGY